ncbi:2-amino-4-hydroxy-6-hydroxymethyldihydropteridine diphosphokinase [Tianweitania sp.]|uniref:2-amino-4-hydroxy-6- hydroxymethyldihydropteridine diphosphokinase n=1 Tax=Tianweitania sp. TaxID=2021634 RepID=UPI00289E9055|nr:2-amino-4-hydroxy-6-hydroxymethyldihydropteridine diphosphokinase [Tianweitania sp.]
MIAVHRAFIGLGGNLGDPQAAMRDALHRLDESAEVSVVAVSSLYRTPPWGKLDQPDFLNAVAELCTTLEPRALLDLCLATESQLKRVRAERWGPRVIDMDVLWFDDRSVKEPGLQVPHPRMSERAFVMVPLAEIAPDLSIAEGSAADVAAGLDKSGITVAASGESWAR